MKTHRETATGETIFTHLDNIIIIIIIWGFFAVFLPKKKKHFFFRKNKTNKNKPLEKNVARYLGIRSGKDFFNWTTTTTLGRLLWCPTPFDESYQTHPSVDHPRTNTLIVHVSSFIIESSIRARSYVFINIDLRAIGASVRCLRK